MGNSTTTHLVVEDLEGKGKSGDKKRKNSRCQYEIGEENNQIDREEGPEEIQ